MVSNLEPCWDRLPAPIAVQRESLAVPACLRWPRSRGSVQGLPPNFQGGLATISITIRPDGAPRRTVLRGILAIDCALGNPPSNVKEGVTVTVPNLITFNTKVSGFTLFVADNNDW